MIVGITDGREILRQDPSDPVPDGWRLVVLPDGIEPDIDEELGIEVLPSGYSLAEWKEAAIKTVVNKANQITEQITSKYPEADRELWGFKPHAAQLILGELASGKTEDEVMLSLANVPGVRGIIAEAHASGRTVVDLCNSVIEKAFVFEEIAGSIAGLNKKARTMISGASSIEEVMSALVSTWDDAKTLLSKYGLSI